MAEPSTCPTCGGCRVASLRWAGGDRWIAEPCPDCRPPDASAGYDRIARQPWTQREVTDVQ